MSDTSNMINIFAGGLIGAIGTGAIGFIKGFQAGRRVGALEAAEDVQAAAAPFRVEPILDPDSGELDRVVMHFKRPAPENL